MTLRKRVDDIKRIKMHSDIIAGEYAIKLIDDLISLLDRAMQGLEAIANAEAFDSWGDLAGRAETTLADIRKALGDTNG